MNRMLLARQARRRLARGLRVLGPSEAPMRRLGCSAAAEGQWSPRALGGQEGPWEVDLGASRGVLQLAGPDAPKLLQGLVTNDVLHLPVPAPASEGQRQQQAAMAAAFLTNKGRIITEAIVSVARDAQPAPHGGPDKLLVDLPLPLKDAVLRHLRLFKLRAKVTITDLSAAARVRVLLGPTAASAAHAASKYSGAALSLATDPRAPPFLGIRAIVPASPEAPPAAASVLAPAGAYEALRLLHGVPEGPDLVERLPSECNIDLLHGINFAKGCYLGQELTARTQFKGVVRKRLLPFFIGGGDGNKENENCPQPVRPLRTLLPAPDASPLLAPPLRVGAACSSGAGSVKPGAEVVDAASGKALGTVVTSAWPRANVGLALLRLEGVLGGGSGGGGRPPVRLVAASSSGEEGDAGRVPLTVFTPLWWPEALDLATGKVPH